MARLLDKFAPVPNQCFCGGSMSTLGFAPNYTCNDCGFIITMLDILSCSSRTESERYLKRLYNEFKSRQSDPMNQLPAHYR